VSRWEKIAFGLWLPLLAVATSLAGCGGATPRQTSSSTTVAASRGTPAPSWKTDAEAVLALVDADPDCRKAVLNATADGTTGAEAELKTALRDGKKGQAIKLTWSLWGVETRSCSQAAVSEATLTSAFSVVPKDPIYGDYERPEFGLIDKHALPYHSDAWFITFPEPGAWSGVVRIAYAGGKEEIGHAYAYTADPHTVRLGAERHLPDLKNRGFDCPSNPPAVYRLWRSSDYGVLRLTAIDDPCKIRRTILEAAWGFID